MSSSAVVNRSAPTDDDKFWPGTTDAFSVSDLGKQVALPSGSTITVGFTTELQFLNALVNCTPHTITLMVRAPDETRDVVPVDSIHIESAGNALRCREKSRKRVRTMPAFVREPVVRRAVEPIDDDSDDDEEERPRKHRSDASSLDAPTAPDPYRTQIDIIAAPVYDGLANDVLPRISRSKCPGIIVSMPVGRYLERLAAENRLDQIDAEATDLDEYSGEENDVAPKIRRRVDVYGPDTSSESVVRDAAGRIVGVRSLIMYNAVY